MILWMMVFIFIASIADADSDADRWWRWRVQCAVQPLLLTNIVSDDQTKWMHLCCEDIINISPPSGSAFACFFRSET